MSITRLRLYGESARPDCAVKKETPMPVEICCRSFDITRSLAAHIRGRVREALKLVARRVTGVTVWIGDINGSHGGVDKSCRIAVCLAQLHTVVASSVADNAYVAVDTAARRLRSAVGERVKRSRCLRRRAHQAGSRTKVA